MARYYDLEVYRAAYLLLVESYKSLRNLNKEYKYTIGEKVKERVFDILLEIYRIARAKETNQKRLHVSNALDHVEYVRLSIRLLRDLGVLNWSSSPQDSNAWNLNWDSDNANTNNNNRANGFPVRCLRDCGYLPSYPQCKPNKYVSRPRP